MLGLLKSFEFTEYTEQIVYRTRFTLNSTRETDSEYEQLKLSPVPSQPQISNDTGKKVK